MFRNLKNFPLPESTKQEVVRKRLQWEYQLGEFHKVVIIRIKKITHFNDGLFFTVTKNLFTCKNTCTYFVPRLSLLVNTI